MRVRVLPGHLQAQGLLGHAVSDHRAVHVGAREQRVIASALELQCIGRRRILELLPAELQALERPHRHADRAGERAARETRAPSGIVQLLFVLQRIAHQAVEVAAGGGARLEAPASHVELALAVGADCFTQGNLPLGDQQVRGRAPQRTALLPGELGKIVAGPLCAQVGERDARAALGSRVQQPIRDDGPQPQRRAVVLVRILGHERHGRIGALTRRAGAGGRDPRTGPPGGEAVVEVQHGNQQIGAVPLRSRPGACAGRQLLIEEGAQL